MIIRAAVAISIVLGFSLPFSANALADDTFGVVTSVNPRPNGAIFFLITPMPSGINGFLIEIDCELNSNHGVLASVRSQYVGILLTSFTTQKPINVRYYEQSWCGLGTCGGINRIQDSYISIYYE